MTERRAPNLSVVPAKFPLTRVLLRFWEKSARGDRSCAVEARYITAFEVQRCIDKGIPSLDD